MKTQTINNRYTIFLLFLLLSLASKLIAQEVTENMGTHFYTNDHAENPLRSNRYIIDSGSKTQWPTQHLPDELQQTKSDGEWNIHRVHSGKFFDDMGDRSLALDADGNPHIAYGGKHLYYAWNDGTEWYIDTVDDSWDVGLFASLALDSGGYPHISYYDRDPNGDLKYAYKDVSGWHIQTVDSSNNSLGLFTSLALDANGHVHISYSDLTEGHLKYANWDGSQWSLQVVDSDGIVGIWCTSLAIGPNNFPHISYFDWANGNLKYAHLDGSDWHIETVDNDDDVGGYSSLALDENGFPHISYLDHANSRLKYAFWNGGEWQLTIVDEGGDWGVGRFNSIALDANGHPHVSYVDHTWGKLKYGFWNGGEWQLMTVDGDWDVGWYTSLALDISGKPHISYYYYGRSLPGARRGLRFAYYDGSEWQYDHVDYELRMDGATSVAVNNESLPHIGYWRSDYTLGYTFRNGNHWAKMDVGLTGSVMRVYGSGSFLDMNSDGKPHMIYHQQFLYEAGVTFPTFIYTWLNGMNWLQEEFSYSNIDDKRFPMSSSLVLDETDNPHMCVYVERWEKENGADLHTSSFLYRWRQDTQWFMSQISFFLYFGEHNSLALDSEALPHVIYTSQLGRLRYSYREENTWNHQIIEQDVDFEEHGAYNSLQIDSYDFPHVSYYDPGNTALKYAHWDGSEWQIEIVDNNGDVGKYTSLDLDANNFPHISYYDESNRNLKYAYWDGSQWQIEIVDSYRIVGLHTSLTLDANGNPHISYYDQSFGDLKYATKANVVSADFLYEIGENEFFKLYPNPTDGTFTLELTTMEFKQGITVEIYTMLGGRVFSIELPPQRQQPLSLEGQQPGMYIIRVIQGDRFSVERLIKR